MNKFFSSSSDILTVSMTRSAEAIGHHNRTQIQSKAIPTAVLEKQHKRSSEVK